MTRKTPHIEEPSEKDLVVGDGPKSWAAGVPGVYHSMKPAIEQMGLNRTRKTVMAMNQKDGFDCPSCAWPDPAPPQGVRVLRERGQGGDLGSDPGGGSRNFLGRECRQRPAQPDRVLAWHAGPPDRTGVQARRRGPLQGGQLGRGAPARGRQAQGPGLPRPGGVLHERPDLERGCLPLPAHGPRLRHQQPAGLLQYVPRILRLGHGPDHRHRQGDGQLRRLRQSRPDHHHGPEPGHQPPPDDDRT